MDDFRISEEISKYNNAPAERLSLLSPAQVYELIYRPLGTDSIVKFSPQIDDETLNSIPFFRIAELLLKIIQRDGFIKLTPLGALPKKVVVELYESKFISEYVIESGLYKLYSEEYCLSIKTARIVCQSTNLVKKSNGKLLLTKNGEKFLKSDQRAQLFKTIYLNFTEKFNWSYNDGYVEEPVAQYGYLFSIFLLKKYGGEPNTTSFYSTKYLQVFEKFLTFFEDTYGTTPEENFDGCYSLRTFERFTEWFGFTVITEKLRLVNKNYEVSKTALLDKIFLFD